jgi:hypothetical protein
VKAVLFDVHPLKWAVHFDALFSLVVCFHPLKSLMEEEVVLVCYFWFAVDVLLVPH